MNAVDTNVLVDGVDQSDPVKHVKAVTLLASLVVSAAESVLMWQVAGEFLQQLRRMELLGKLRHDELLQTFAKTRASFRLIAPVASVLDRSLDLASRFSLSRWDSMIVAACIEAGVTKLYTEDLGSPTKFDSLELENPFQ
jgi:predicted nucleic acid-binding protein